MIYRVRVQQSAEAAGRDMCYIINSLLPTLISLASSIETNRFSHKLLIRQALTLEEFIAIFVKLATTSGRLVHFFSFNGIQGLQSGSTTWGYIGIQRLQSGRLTLNYGYIGIQILQSDSLTLIWLH